MNSIRRLNRKDLATVFVRRASASGQEGFTLLELLIALSILVFMSFGIYQATTETFRLRDSLSHEGDFHNTIRLAMGVVERDVALIYSPTLMIPPKDEPKKPGDPSNPNPPNSPNPGFPPGAGTPDPDLQRMQEGDGGRPSNFWGGVVHKSGIRPSRFIGTDTKMSFVSASHRRIYKDARESDFAKITYQIRKDDAATPDSGLPEGSDVLVKTEDTDVFSLEDEKLGRKPTESTVPLLHGVTKFKIRYYRKEKDTWYPSWDSDKEETKNQYPDMIEFVFEVKGPRRLSFDGLYRFRPEVPLHGLDPST